MQNIVVDREEDAKSAIAFLKQRDGGRATFLPLTAIRGDELRERGVEQEFGFVGVASRLVRFDPKYTNIFNSLLGRTVIAEDLDCGIAMARKYRNAFRIVTLDGQVINRGGSMTGGSTSRSAGVLSRAAELETAEQPDGGACTEGWRRPERRRRAPRRELDAAQYELATAEAQRRAAEDEVLRLQGVKNQFDMLLADLRESVGEPERRTGQPLTAGLADNEGRAAAAEETVAEQEAEAAELPACRRRRSSPARASCWPSPGSWRRPSAAHKAELASLAANREGALRRAADLRQLAAELSGDRSQKEAALAAATGSRSERRRRRSRRPEGRAGGTESAERRHCGAAGGHQSGEDRAGGGAHRQEPRRAGDERDPPESGAGGSAGWKRS